MYINVFAIYYNNMAQNQVQLKSLWAQRAQKSYEKQNKTKQGKKSWK